MIVEAAELVAAQAAMSGARMVRDECQRALTQKRTLWGSGALELADLGLLEDGGELGDALVSDRVVAETATEGWSEDGQKSGVSAGADTKANTWEVVRVPKQPT